MLAKSINIYNVSTSMSVRNLTNKIIKTALQNLEIFYNIFIGRTHPPVTNDTNDTNDTKSTLFDFPLAAKILR